MEETFVPFDDEIAYDFDWNDLEQWEFEYKYCMDDSDIERYVKRHGEPQA